MRRPLGWWLALGAAIGVLFRPPVVQAAAVAAAVVAALLIDRRVLQAALSVGVVLGVLFGTAVTWAMVAWSSDPATGFEVAAAMLLRLLVLAILAALLARNVDADALLRGARRLGLERTLLVLGLALNVLPRLVDVVRQVGMAWRVRRRAGVGRTPPPGGLAEVVLAHVARIADEAAAAAALRGHRSLVQPAVGVAAATRVVVATGPPHSGKTTAAQQVASRARAAGWRVTGFSQPASYRDGDKVGFSVRDLATGEEAPLARLVPRTEGEHGTRYRFEEAGFALARAAVRRVRSGDLLVVDELGPLELRGGGHMPAVRRALRGVPLVGALVVVRSQLVPALLASLEADEAVVVDVGEPDGVERLARAIGLVDGGNSSV